MLNSEQHEDKIILIKNLSRITADYFVFLAKHKDLLAVYEDLNTAFEAHKSTLQSVADEIEEDGVLFDDENIEIKKAGGVISFYPKAIFKNNPQI